MPNIPQIDPRKKGYENIELQKQLALNHQQKKEFDYSTDYIKTISDYVPGARNVNTVNSNHGKIFKRGTDKLSFFNEYTTCIDKDKNGTFHCYIKTEGDLQERDSHIFSKKVMRRRIEKKNFEVDFASHQLTNSKKSTIEMTLPDHEPSNYSTYAKEIPTFKNFALEKKNLTSKALSTHHRSGKAKNFPQVWERKLSNRNINLLNEESQPNLDLPQRQLKIQDLRFNTPTIKIHPSPNFQYEINFKLDKQMIKEKASPKQNTGYISVKTLIKENYQNKRSLEPIPRVPYKEGKNFEAFNYPQIKHKRHVSENDYRQKLNIYEILPTLELRNQTNRPFKQKFRNEEAIVDKIFSVHRRVQTEQE